MTVIKLAEHAIILLQGKGGIGKHALVDLEDAERVAMHKWVLSHDGYPHNTEVGHLHKFLLGPSPPGRCVDHIDGNRFDNRSCNLRLITIVENNKNQHKRSGHFKTRYNGVCHRDGTWVTRVNGKTIGVFATPKAAAAAYDSACLAQGDDLRNYNSLAIHDGLNRLSVDKPQRRDILTMRRIVQKALVANRANKLVMLMKKRRRARRKEVRKRLEQQRKVTAPIDLKLALRDGHPSLEELRRLVDRYHLWRDRIYNFAQELDITPEQRQQINFQDCDGEEGTQAAVRRFVMCFTRFFGMKHSLEERNIPVAMMNAWVQEMQPHIGAFMAFGAGYKRCGTPWDLAISLTKRILHAWCGMHMLGHFPRYRIGGGVRIYDKQHVDAYFSITGPTFPAKTSPEHTWKHGEPLRLAEFVKPFSQWSLPLGDANV